MGLFDNLKKKTEQLASDASKIADKTLKDASTWTEQAIKDTSDWTEQAIKDTKEWTEQAMKDMGNFASDTWENKEKYAKDLKQWSLEMPDKLKDYTSHFNVEDFWDKIAETGKKIGQNMIFMALACYYAIMEMFNKDKGEKESDINSK